MDLDERVTALAMDKAAFKKMTRGQSSAFNRIKLNLPKFNREFDTEINTFREKSGNPEKRAEESPSESGSGDTWTTGTTPESSPSSVEMRANSTAAAAQSDGQEQEESERLRGFFWDSDSDELRANSAEASAQSDEEEWESGGDEAEQENGGNGAPRQPSLQRQLSDTGRKLLQMAVSDEAMRAQAPWQRTRRNQKEKFARYSFGEAGPKVQKVTR